MPWAPAPARTTHLSLFIWKCHLLAPLAGSAVMDGWGCPGTGRRSDPSLQPQEWGYQCRECPGELLPTCKRAAQSRARAETKPLRNPAAPNPPIAQK